MKAPRIVLPSGARPRFQCNVPGCGEVFWESSQLVRHMKACVRRNRDELEEAARINAARDPLANVFDEEAVEYQRKRYGLF